MSGWHIYPAETPIFWAMLLLLATQTAGHARNVAYLIVDTYRRRHRSLTSRAPAGASVRQSQRPTPTQGPAMPDERDVTRIGRPDYGPPLTQGFPGVGEPQRDRRGLLVGLVAFVVTAAIAGVIGGAYFLWPHSGPKTETVKVPAAAASPTYDAATLDACKSADVVKSNPDAKQDAQSVRADAEVSDQQALRDIAQRYSHPEAYGQPIDDVYALTASLDVYRWCLWRKLVTP